MKKSLVIGGLVLGLAILIIFLFNNPAENSQLAKKSSDKANISKDEKQSTSKVTEGSSKIAQKTSEEGTEIVTEENPSDQNQDGSIDQEAVIQLQEKYRVEFQKISFTADKRVESLIEQAHQEFMVKKERKENLTQFNTKYEAILDNYEKTAKGQFDTIFSQFEQEAIESKLPLGIGQEFKEIYENKKIERYSHFKEELDKLS